MAWRAKARAVRRPRRCRPPARPSPPDRCAGPPRAHSRPARAHGREWRKTVHWDWSQRVSDGNGAGRAGADAPEQASLCQGLRAIPDSELARKREGHPALVADVDEGAATIAGQVIVGIAHVLHV